MLQLSLGENEPQNRMCLSACHKITSGLFVTQNLMTLLQVWLEKIENTMKHQIFPGDLGAYMTSLLNELH